MAVIVSDSIWADFVSRNSRKDRRKYSSAFYFVYVSTSVLVLTSFLFFSWRSRLGH